MWIKIDRSFLKTFCVRYYYANLIRVMAVVQSDVASGPLVRFGGKCKLVLILILLTNPIVQVGN